MPSSRTTDKSEDLAFRELVDVTGFSKLLRQLCDATGVPVSLVGRDGEIVLQAGCVDVCSRLEPANPGTERLNPHHRSEPLHDPPTDESVCRALDHGLIDCAAPVIVEGRHLATLWLGEVFGEPPDLDLFRERAARCGRDESEYLAVVRSVPVVDKARLEALTKCLVGVAQMFAASGLSAMRRSRWEVDLEQIRLQDVLDRSPLGIGWSDASGKIEYVNHRFTELFGYTLDDLPDLETWFHLAFPDPAYRREVIGPWNREVALTRLNGGVPPELEAGITCKDGSERRVLVRVSWIDGKRLVYFSDITAHWRGELRNQTHDAMLEMVARGAPLTDILGAIVQAVESERPDWRCSVRLMDAEAQGLRTCVAPSLPAFFNEARDGMETADTGARGTANHRGERVIAPDILSHPDWQSVRGAALRAGVAACWSEPISASDGEVLGAFDVYHAQPVAPDRSDISRIGFATNLAAIAIENRKSREKLVEQARTFRTLSENAPDNIARYDTECRLIYHNPMLEKTMHKPSAQLLGRRPTEHVNGSLLDDYEAKLWSVLKTGKAAEFELEIPTPAGMAYHWLHMVAERDAAGKITGVLAMGRDITERKRMQEELERQARSDYLTGLTNRRHFLELAENELSRVARYGGALSLIMFDVDHFKRINDTRGHSIGDLVLQSIAATTRETMRENDIVGRIGGEEFVVLLPETGKSRAVEAAERLRSAIAASEVGLKGGESIRVTASFGVVTLADESTGIDELLIRADAAMYEAKEGGRNRVCLSPRGEESVSSFRP